MGSILALILRSTHCRRTYNCSHLCFDDFQYRPVDFSRWVNTMDSGEVEFAEKYRRRWSWDTKSSKYEHVRNFMSSCADTAALLIFQAHVPTYVFRGQLCEQKWWKNSRDDFRPTVRDAAAVWLNYLLELSENMQADSDPSFVSRILCCDVMDSLDAQTQIRTMVKSSSLIPRIRFSRISNLHSWWWE